MIISLGVATDLSLKLTQAAITEEVTVTAQTSDGVQLRAHRRRHHDRPRRDRRTSPRINDRINDYARLSPQYSGGPFGGVFVGQDNRLNNITVDGSYFNNSFGLGGQPGDRTGVTPISTAAVEEIQINVAPYDVRQGHFVGAGVNMVTRSGANQFRGSAYCWTRDNGLVGTEAKGQTVQPRHLRLRPLRRPGLSGPILKDKLFFFGSYEDDKFTQPGTTFRANKGGETVGGNVTRVLASDLDALSAYLKHELRLRHRPLPGLPLRDAGQAVPGEARLQPERPEQDERPLPAARLARPPVLASNSSSLGVRQPPHQHHRPSTSRTPTTRILENIKSGVGEWNSILGSNTANSLIVGYTTNDESRPQSGELFPMVDIRESGTTYTTFGYEPFTPSEPAPLQHVPDPGQLHLEPRRATRSPSAGPSSATTPTTCSSRDPRASTSTTRSRTSTPTPTTTSRTRTGRRRR